MKKMFYCKCDNMYHYYEEVPANLKSFVDYRFSSGPVAGSDFKSFNTKFRNAIIKLLPDGYRIHQWNKNHYECSAVIRTPKYKFIYMSIPDVRYWQNEWLNHILIRAMENDHDWRGGNNHYTSLFTFTKDIQKIYKE